MKKEKVSEGESEKEKRKKVEKKSRGRKTIDWRGKAQGKQFERNLGDV